MKSIFEILLVILAFFYLHSSALEHSPWEERGGRNETEQGIWTLEDYIYDCDLLEDVSDQLSQLSYTSDQVSMHRSLLFLYLTRCKHLEGAEVPSEVPLYVVQGFYDLLVGLIYGSPFIEDDPLSPSSYLRPIDLNAAKNFSLPIDNLFWIPGLALPSEEELTVDKAQDILLKILDHWRSPSLSAAFSSASSTDTDGAHHITLSLPRIAELPKTHASSALDILYNVIKRFARSICPAPSSPVSLPQASQTFEGSYYFLFHHLPPVSDVGITLRLGPGKGFYTLVSSSNTGMNLTDRSTLTRYGPSTFFQNVLDSYDRRSSSNDSMFAPYVSTSLIDIVRRSSSGISRIE